MCLSVISILFAFLFAFPGAVTADSDTAIVPEKVYRQVSDCILSAQYSEAEAVTDSFMTAHPGEPSGPLFKAAVLQYQSTDYENYTREEEFMGLLDRAEELANKRIKDNKKDLWAQYYRAAANGLRGAWLSASGNLISGVMKGRSGAKGMERIIETEPDFFDAYLLTGSYRFWRNVALDRLSWLPFIDVEINGGIDTVKKAIEKGKLTGTLSNTVLLEMLLEYDPEAAADLGERLNIEHPGCRLFAWQLGEAYKKIERYDDAVRVFTEIAESMEYDPLDDGSGRLRCFWKLAVLAKTVGKIEDCLYYCNVVIEYEQDDTVADNQKNRIENAKRLRKELNEQIR